MRSLSPEKALIFRIVHKCNLPWLLEHGLHCQTSGVLDPHHISIGNVELIGRRLGHLVPLEPNGTLGDYIPFYFTPSSLMLYNIKSGWGGLRAWPNDQIVVLVSSLRTLARKGIDFLFTDRHAYLQAARFFGSLNDLDQVDWSILRSRDFQRDPDDPGKFERYQAEALVHKALPSDGLMGVACYDDAPFSRCAGLPSLEGTA